MRRDVLLLGEMIEAADQAQKRTDGITKQFPDIAWKQPVRLRNRIVHGYWSVDLEILHTAAREQLPQFAADLRRVLASVDEGT
ncbi:DUF86 domain-containing protein [Frankia sp. CiP3]|uniref:HepT-like ribonuclease domain-containing protein n=1 Tax=Frankia sp. CiP3 TaxID=2880971 RepID=UPI001EF4F852|nr:HepT-like ribonuclease domain-containing protein [Frankia sp. CiP3]